MRSLLVRGARPLPFCNALLINLTTRITQQLYSDLHPLVANFDQIPTTVACESSFAT